MQVFESENTEFKQEYVKDIRKEVVAFANSEGGAVIIGVRKDGEVVGVENPDEVMLQTVNSLKDSIAPDVMPFVNVVSRETDGKYVVEINVSVGTNRPYYIREKGLKPTGVYVRKRSSAQPVTDEGIREMIIQNSGKSFENGRSLNQDLTFVTFSEEMKKRSIEFGTSQMRTLHFIGGDGLYTNLALLLSDQCEVTTKVAVFQGRDKEVFRDRKEFSGSLLKQLEDVYRFIDLNNRIKSTFFGLDRIDVRDYPEEAVREALLNSMVHRDYSFSGSNLINIYEDRIEFVSLGGLVSGLELRSIFLGVSQSRNPNLASVFYRMSLIESYGTGIAKIRRAYRNNNEKPAFETAQGVFRVTLPDRNETETGMDAGERKKAGMDSIVYIDRIRKETQNLENVKRCEILELQKRRILEYAIRNGKITRKETEKLIGAGTTKAFRLLRELCDEGKLETQGNGRLSCYVSTISK